jgi:hypothetical protein
MPRGCPLPEDFCAALFGAAHRPESAQEAPSGRLGLLPCVVFWGCGAVPALEKGHWPPGLGFRRTCRHSGLETDSLYGVGTAAETWFEKTLSTLFVSTAVVT